MNEDSRLDDKRSFLKGAINGMAFFLAFSLAATGVISLVPRGGPGRKEHYLPLADADEAPRRGVREFTYRTEKGGRQLGGRVLLVRSPQGLIALSPACTHLGCFVIWHREKNEFHCPCHGGRYDISGTHIAGPPPSPLRRFPLEIREGKIFIKVPV